MQASKKHRCQFPKASSHDLAPSAHLAHTTALSFPHHPRYKLTSSLEQQQQRHAHPSQSLPRIQETQSPNASNLLPYTRPQFFHTCITQPTTAPHGGRGRCPAPGPAQPEGEHSRRRRRRDGGELEQQCRCPAPAPFSPSCSACSSARSRRRA